jgi:hypothetical protein
VPLLITLTYSAAMHSPVEFTIMAEPAPRSLTHGQRTSILSLLSNSLNLGRAGTGPCPGTGIQYRIQMARESGGNWKSVPTVALLHMNRIGILQVLLQGAHRLSLSLGGHQLISLMLLPCLPLLSIGRYARAPAAAALEAADVCSLRWSRTLQALQLHS